jgi:hydrogenase maturation protease
MVARIIGIGQATAGDDGVGIAVVRRLKKMALPDGIEVVEIAEPSALIDSLLGGADPVILVDAVVGGGEPGRIVQFEAGDALALGGPLKKLTSEPSPARRGSCKKSARAAPRTLSRNQAGEGFSQPLEGGTLLTTHGVGVLEAVRLARRLSPETVARHVHVVGVTIERPRRYGEGLSAAVGAAVERAAETALRLARLSL